jgi:hypothetical protein
MDAPCAIGRLDRDGPWVGFTMAEGRYHLAVGREEESIRTDAADDGLLLALAIAYFEDTLEEPPPPIEATHADLSRLVRNVAEREADPVRRRLLGEAVDSIDDGLAVDEVIGRLVTARSRTAAEQADPLDLLRERAEALMRRP